MRVTVQSSAVGTEGSIMSKGIDVQVKGAAAKRAMVITVPIPKGSEYLSTSGKTFILAHGLSAWELVVDGSPVKVELNAYRRNPDYVKPE